MWVRESIISVSSSRVVQGKKKREREKKCKKIKIGYWYIFKTVKEVAIRLDQNQNWQCQKIWPFTSWQGTGTCGNSYRLSRLHPTLQLSSKRWFLYLYITCNSIKHKLQRLSWNSLGRAVDMSSFTSLSLDLVPSLQPSHTPYLWGAIPSSLLNFSHYQHAAQSLARHKRPVTLFPLLFGATKWPDDDGPIQCKKKKRKKWDVQSGTKVLEHSWTKL